MNPYIQHHLADARIADMLSHAERQRTARAARRARRAAQRPAGRRSWLDVHPTIRLALHYDLTQAR
jgi:hypothetical protein